MREFISRDRKQYSLLPPSIEEWLPEDHLARFVVEICDQLDLSKIYNQYGLSGSPPYDPRLLLGMLFYGYSTGVFSSRKIEMASYDSVAFRYIAGNLHPDHDTIATFRKQYLSEIGELFVQILVIARTMGFLKIGKVNIDGTKIQANASKHKAMSYERIILLEKQYKEEITRLLTLAEQADSEANIELDIPAEIQRREVRLAKIKEAKEALEARAEERDKLKMAEYDEKMKVRQETEKASGKKIRGEKPKPPKGGPKPKDQYNFTDSESRIMKTSDGFDQCYNAQAVVTEDLLIAGAYANAHCNDKEELLPALDSIPKQAGQVETVAADAGYFSEANITGTLQRDIDPHIAVGKQAHNQWLDQYLARLQQSESDPTASPKEKMSEKLKTEKGRSVYRLRKMTVETVFGIIKEIMGFRRFSLRGEQAANGEWLLVCCSFNLKRLFKLSLG